MVLRRVGRDRIPLKWVLSESGGNLETEFLSRSWQKWDPAKTLIDEAAAVALVSQERGMTGPF